VSLALRLYPLWWRERYADEVEVVAADLLEHGRPLGTMTAGLVWGAVRTRVGARGMPQDADLWGARARASMVVAVAPAIVVLPLLFTMRQVARSSAPAVGPAHLASFAYLGLMLGFVGLVVAAVWGYATLSAGLLEGSPRAGLSRRFIKAPGRLLLLGIALFAAALVVGPHAFSMRTGHAPVALNGHPAVAYGLKAGAGAALVGCGLVTIVLLARMVRRSTLSAHTLVSGRRISRLISIVLMAMTVAATMVSLSFGQLGAPSNNSVTVTMLGGSLWLLVALLGLATGVSCAGASAAARSLRATTRITTS
jgi:hypothetical protein